MTISIILLSNFSFQTRLDYTIGTFLWVLIFLGGIFGGGSLIIIILVEVKKKEEIIIKQIMKDLESPKLIKFQKYQLRNKSFFGIFPIIILFIPLIALTWISNEIMVSGNFNLASATLFMGYSIIIPVMIIFGFKIILSYVKYRKLLRNHDKYFAKESKNDGDHANNYKKNASSRSIWLAYADNFYCGNCGTNINSKMFQKAKNNVIEPNGLTYYLCKKCDKKSLVWKIITYFIILGLLMGVILILAITLLIEGIDIYQGIYFSILIFSTILIPNIWVLFFIPTLLYFYFQHKNRYK